MISAFQGCAAAGKAILLTLLFSGIILSCSSQEPMKKYSLIVSNVTVIPMNKDTSIKNVDVFVSEGKIDKIEKHEKRRKLGLLSDVIIDASDQYLLPGLVDCHAHYGDNVDLFDDYDSLYLKYGVTKIIALNGSDQLLEHRKKIKNKTANGPDIVCSSPRNNDPSLTADQANRLLKEYKRKGYDFVKIYNELSTSGFDAFNQNAEENDLRVLGHIPNSIGIYGVLHSNMELVSHAEDFLYHPPVKYMMGEVTQPVKPDESYINLLADSVTKYGKYVSPTLIAFSSILSSVGNINDDVSSAPLSINHPIAVHWQWSPSINFYPRKFSTSHSINRLQYAYDYQLKLVKAFHDAGVKILTGTDAPTIPGLVPGHSLHQEMQILSKVGLSNYDVLKSATVNAAQFLNISNQFGTIEEGKEASFILLSNNPLVNIENTLSIKKVFKCGEMF